MTATSSPRSAALAAAPAALVLWTLAAPWALGASDSPPALAAHIAFAMAFLPLAILTPALRPAAVVGLLGGLWLALSPFAAGFAAEGALALNDALVGVALAGTCGAWTRSPRDR